MNWETMIKSLNDMLEMVEYNEVEKIYNQLAKLTGEKLIERIYDAALQKDRWIEYRRP